jgi:hypothetical protein
VGGHGRHMRLGSASHMWQRPTIGSLGDTSPSSHPPLRPSRALSCLLPHLWSGPFLQVLLESRLRVLISAQKTRTGGDKAEGGLQPWYFCCFHGLDIKGAVRSGRAAVLSARSICLGQRLPNHSQESPIHTASVMDWFPVIDPFIGDLHLQDFGYDKPRAEGTDVPTVLRFQVSMPDSQPLGPPRFLFSVTV